MPSLLSVSHNYNLRSSTKQNKILKEIKYRTRSVTSQFEKIYSFDEASTQWNLNKNKHEQGSYSYKSN